METVGTRAETDSAAVVEETEDVIEEVEESVGEAERLASSFSACPPSPLTLLRSTCI